MTREQELQEAKDMLAAWKEAERAVATSQSYTVAGRTVTRAQMTEIRAAQEYWRTEIARLEGGRGPGMRVRRIVPRDL